jgi:hypothetical protein
VIIAVSFTVVRRQDYPPPVKLLPVAALISLRSYHFLRNGVVSKRPVSYAILAGMRDVGVLRGIMIIRAPFPARFLLPAPRNRPAYSKLASWKVNARHSIVPADRRP